MSGNAALAAAKRRRNPVEQQFSSNTYTPDILQEEEPCLAKLINNKYINDNGIKTNKTANITNPIQLLREHDKEIFVLERRLEMLEEKSGMDNSSNSSNSSELENFRQNTNSELKLLKSSFAKQQKSMQELTTLVTSLRATISNQNTTINNLTEELNSTTLQDTDVKNKSTMKLHISETI